MKKIETGVDKLVEIIEAKKKVSLDDAAKQLGVSTILVQEWADFLEEDGVISIEYSLSKVWLVERKLSKKEVVKKEKEYGHKKEAFIRKVETTLQSLDRDTIGFEKMKEEFKDLNKDIGGEVGFVKKELKELQYYETLKNNIDKDIAAQRKEYEKLMNESHLQIKAEERRYQELLARIQTEERKVSREKNIVKTLEQKEQDMEKRIAEMREFIEQVKKEVRRDTKSLEISESNVKKLEHLTKHVTERIKDKKHRAIIPLIKISEEHRERVLKLQDEILRKLKIKKEEIAEYEGQKKHVYDHLKSFFDKKAKAEQLLQKIERDKTSLQKDYDQLIKKAKAFNVIAKNADVKKHLTQLEKKYLEVENQKSKLQQGIEKLSKLIKG